MTEEWLNNALCGLKAKKAAADNTRSQHKAGCRTCQHDCLLLTPPLALFLLSLFMQSWAGNVKGSKACQHTNATTHTRLPSAATWTGVLCDCFGRTTRQVFLFSCKPVRPLWTLPPSSPSVFCSRQKASYRPSAQGPGDHCHPNAPRHTPWPGILLMLPLSDAHLRLRV